MQENNQQESETGAKKMNWILPILIVLVLGGGFMFLAQKKSNTNKIVALATTTASQQPTTTIVTDSSTISVEGGMFYFKPNEIRVKKGETVKIAFTNVEGMHDFVLDEFNIKTKVISAGKSETVEFTPDQTGEFEFYCSVSDHRKKGMVGKLIVTE